MATDDATDPRGREFFTTTGALNPREAAQVAQGTLHPAEQGPSVLNAASPLYRAKFEHISYLQGLRWLPGLVGSGVGLLLTNAYMREVIRNDKRFASRMNAMHLVECRNPNWSFSRLIERLYRNRYSTPVGVAPSASVAASAVLGERVWVGERAVVGREVRIGSGSVIGAGAVIGDGVVIGNDCEIGPGCSVSYAVIGDRVRLEDGAKIGMRGMGFTADAGEVRDVPQIGRVVIHDGVEIGAGTTIDRGKIDDTIIGAGCRIDNQVQVAHNVVLGRGCLVLSQTSISGSVTFGDGVICGGLVGFEGHVHVASGARIMGGSLVAGDITRRGVYSLSPAMPLREASRVVRFLRQIALGKGHEGADDTAKRVDKNAAPTFPSPATSKGFASRGTP